MHWTETFILQCLKIVYTTKTLHHKNLVHDSAVWDLFWPTSIKSGVFDSCSLNSKDVRAHSECFDIWRLSARCWTLQRLTCRPHQLTHCVLGRAGLNGRRRGSLEWGDRGSMRIECIIKWGCHSWEAKRLSAQEHEVKQNLQLRTWCTIQHRPLYPAFIYLHKFIFIYTPSLCPSAGSHAS